MGIHTFNVHLLRAAARADLAELQRLIASIGPGEPIDLNVNDGLGRTPLMLAVTAQNVEEEQRTEVVRLLLESGADVDGGNRNTPSALHLAVVERSATMVELLVEHGANVNTMGSGFVSDSLDTTVSLKPGFTPMHVAAMRDWPEGVKLLHGVGAKVNEADMCGSTPMHVATADCNHDVMDALRMCGATLDHKNLEGKTPLFLAVEWGSASVVDHLLTMGAQVDSIDNEGWTPLHHGGDRNHHDIVKLLAHRGATLEAKNSEGQTPLHVACRTKSLRDPSDQESQCILIDNLLEAGSDVHARDKEKRTPLMLARSNNDWSETERNDPSWPIGLMLIARGAKASHGPPINAKVKRLQAMARLGQADQLLGILEARHDAGALDVLRGESLKELSKQAREHHQFETAAMLDAFAARLAIDALAGAVPAAPVVKIKRPGL